MFNFFKKKPVGSTAKLTIQGMHCASCAMLIDNELEALPGVTAATTSYAHSQTTVKFDPEKTTIEAITGVVKKCGYQVAKK